jgi:hypothetical protein
MLSIENVLLNKERSTAAVLPVTIECYLWYHALVTSFCHEDYKCAWPDKQAKRNWLLAKVCVARDFVWKNLTCRSVPANRIDRRMTISVRLCCFFHWLTVLKYAERSLENSRLNNKTWPWQVPFCYFASHVCIKHNAPIMIITSPARGSRNTNVR